MKFSFLCILFWGLAVFQNPALAQSQEPASAPETATIEADSGLPADAGIRARIEEIFSRIEALRGVVVEVNAGVVTLRGAVATSENVARAASLAGRVKGVVTVENRIDRDLPVEEKLAPALSRLKENMNNLVGALPLVLVTLAIAVLIALAGHLLAGIGRLWRWIAPNNFLAEILATSIRVLFIALGLFVAFDILGATAALGAILGGAGVIGLAIGFAVRDTVDNYISSIMLSIRQPFRPNDHVVIGTCEGRVVRLTSRATILMTLDGNHLRVPNATVYKSNILNYTRNPERRFDFTLGIDADDDPVEGTLVATQALRELDFVLTDPPPSAYIAQVGDSNIVLTVMGWVSQNDTDFLKARSVAIRAAKMRLESAGFALPEPIYRLRFDDPSLVSRLAGAGVRQPSPEAARKTPARSVDDSVEADVSRDTYLERKVAEERITQGEDDLLSRDQPIE